MRLRLATPAELTFPDPSEVLPLKKLTPPRLEPVGVGATVAVSVTDCPAFAGFGEALSTVPVEVRAGLIVSVTAEDVEDAKPVLPE